MTYSCTTFALRVRFEAGARHVGVWRGGEAGWWYTSRGYDVWPRCVSLGVGCGLIVDYSEISTAC
jgi:hypothetical protein